MRYPIDYDIRAALDAAGIRWKSSGGGWIRCKAIWRDSREDDLCIKVDSGGWIDQGGDRASGNLRALCDRLGLDRPTRREYSPEEKAAWVAAKRAREAKDKALESETIAGAKSIWSHTVPLGDETSPRAAAMRDYIAYRGLRWETVAEVARAGWSQKRPCLIYGRRNPITGEIDTIHREWDKRTWPEEEGGNKRGLGPAKFSNQSVYAVYNQGRIGKTNLAQMAESQLTGAAGAEINPDTPTICFFGKGGLNSPARKVITDLYDAGHTHWSILADADQGGIEAAHECARQILLICPKAIVTISAPPSDLAEKKKGLDWLDVYAGAGFGETAGLGADATRALIDKFAVPPRCVAQPAPTTEHKVAFIPRVQPHAPIWPGPIRQTVRSAEITLSRALWREIFEDEKPSIIVGEPGLGKSTNLARLAAKLWKIKRAGGRFVDSDKSYEARMHRVLVWYGRRRGWRNPLDHIPPILLLVPDLAQVAELVAMINKIMPGLAVAHKGRDQDNCFQYVTIEALMNRSRAPMAAFCQDCEHGLPDNKCAEDVEPCAFMQNMRASEFFPIVVAAHAAGAEKSLLYGHREIDMVGGQDEAWVRPRKIAVDEAPPMRSPGLVPDEKTPGAKRGSISADDIREWRGIVPEALESLQERIAKLRADPEVVGILETQSEIKKLRRQMRANRRIGRTITSVREALRDRKRALKERTGRADVGDENKWHTFNALRSASSWTRRMALWLQKFDDARHAAPIDDELHKTDPDAWAALANLCLHVPDEATHRDGSVLEKIVWDKGQQIKRLPLRGLHGLGMALREGGCMFYRGHIAANHTPGLWRQVMARGGIILDGTPKIRMATEARASGGRVHVIRALVPDECEVRHVQIINRLNGRSGLSDPETMGARVENVRQRIQAGAVVLTHMPISRAVLKAVDGQGEDPNSIMSRIRYWGPGHKAHNDWKNETDLHIDGLQIPNGLDQQMGYECDRRALAAIGVEWPAWDGTTTRNLDVIGNTHTYEKVRHPLPSVPMARLWLHDQVEGDLAQADARLRAIRPNGRTSITTTIASSFPILGLHGLHMDEVRLENDQSRVSKSLKTEGAILEVLKDHGRDAPVRTVKRIVLEKLGITPSMTTIQRVRLAVESEALRIGETLEDTTKMACTRVQLWTRGPEPIEQIIEKQKRVSPGDLAVTELLAAIAENAKPRPQAAQAP